ncbi:MAG: YcfL family protein [Planctomycetota bacterium]|nr:YcfL family protein [Planctomycetota bacterium]
MMRLAVLCLVLASFLAAGCEAPDRAPAPGYGDPYPAPLNDPQISVLSEELRPWLLFSPATVTKGERRPMQVQVPVRNAAARRYLIEYRILFYDENGAELEPLMSWKMVPLEPKQTVRLKAGALDAAAESYRLEIKWSR